MSSCRIHLIIEMELEQLRAFLEVARTKSFTAAGRSMCVSHSTVSRAVSSLEAELGVSLIDRGNRVLGLTEAGKRLYERGPELLALADDIADDVRRG